MAAINYKWLKTDIDFTLDYKYTGKMPQFYINEEGDPVEGYISAFNTMDFTVQRSFFRNRLTIGAGVKNIFDNTTIPSVGTSAGCIPVVPAVILLAGEDCIRPGFC